MSSPTREALWDDIEEQMLVFTTKGVVGRSKIAGFDLDHTLIDTQSGKLFSPSHTDWRMLCPEVLPRLKALWDSGYKIAVFTNQLTIHLELDSVANYKSKIEDIAVHLEVPVQIFVAPKPNLYRKPVNGMWKHLIEKANDGVTVKLEESFYVGDAAGRVADWAPMKKKDFSCSDKTFAANIGIDFYTPEEFFLKQKPAPFEWPTFDPRNLDFNKPLLNPSNATLKSEHQEIIIMVGYPAYETMQCDHSLESYRAVLSCGGKTTFAKKHLVPQGYVHVGMTDCGTVQEGVAACREALSQGNSVVVDSTNPDKEVRKRYIDCARQAQVSCRCFQFDVSLEHAEHNGKLREMVRKQMTFTQVTEKEFSTYKLTYEEPSIDEGFTEIIQVNFIPTFEEDWVKELYMQFLYEILPASFFLETTAFMRQEGQ